MTTLTEFMIQQDAIKEEHGHAGFDHDNTEATLRRIEMAGLDHDEVSAVAHQMANFATQAALAQIQVGGDVKLTLYDVIKGMWVDGLVTGRLFDD